MTEETKKQKRPVEFVYGNVKLLEWSNEDSKGNPFKTYQAQKFYKDADGNWKTTSNLSEVELLKLGYLISSFVSNVKLQKKDNE